MPELTHRERLQPSLLDRLTDDDRDHSDESREKRVLSPIQLRESVRRDLGSLFNTVHMAAVEDLDDYPEVKRSVLNFGLPDLAGHTVSGIDLPRVEQMLKQAIWDFEPRLIRNTVRVKLVTDTDAMNHNSMQFLIEAELWAQPLPLQLFLKTQIDLEDGDVVVAYARGKE